jgi:fatty acid desaturase
MTPNVGMIDRMVRIVIGVALIALAMGYIPAFAPQIWGWLGVVPLVTGVLGTCPVYSLIGMNTCAR